MSVLYGPTAYFTERYGSTVRYGIFDEDLFK